MVVGEAEFVRLLTRVVRIHRECRQFNSPYSVFKYELSEHKGVLRLSFSFPHVSDMVTVVYDGNPCEEAERKLQEAEDYLSRRAVSTAPDKSS